MKWKVRIGDHEFIFSEMPEAGAFANEAAEHLIMHDGNEELETGISIEPVVAP